MKKIIAINASPRTEWNTATLVKEAAKGAKSEGAISFDNPRITDNEKCISCMKCISVCSKNARVLNPAVLEAVSERLSKVCSTRKENELFL